MNQIVGMLKLLWWKTKVQTFGKELIFNIRKYILGKVKNNFFGIVFSNLQGMQITSKWLASIWAKFIGFTNSYI